MFGQERHEVFVHYFQLRKKIIKLFVDNWRMTYGTWKLSWPRYRYLFCLFFREGSTYCTPLSFICSFYISYNRFLRFFFLFRPVRPTFQVPLNTLQSIPAVPSARTLPLNPYRWTSFTPLLVRPQTHTYKDLFSLSSTFLGFRLTLPV